MARKKKTPGTPEPMTEAQARTLAVGYVLNEEIRSGHMTPLLAQNLLRRMDAAFKELKTMPFPEPEQTTEPAP